MLRRKSSSSSAEASKTNAQIPKRHSSPASVVGHQRSRSSSVAVSPSPSPSSWPRIKSIMKIATLDQSLHSTYGSDCSNHSRTSNSTSPNKKQRERICFKNIEIREYARTVGDNPSVSSGTLAVLASACWVVVGGLL